MYESQNFASPPLYHDEVGFEDRERVWIGELLEDLSKCILAQKH